MDILLLEDGLINVRMGFDYLIYSVNMDIQSVKAVLEKHHSSQNYKPEKHYPNVVNAKGRYLGPYVPYIGEYYLYSKPKVLIYAMAQNLARVPNIIRDWLDNDDHGLHRQYQHSDNSRISLHPYDTGHLKVIAALISASYPETDYRPSDNIHDKVAVTNFVKFSFFKDGKSGQLMDANPPASIYNDMWKHFCEYEVSSLQPDIVIGVGNDVYNALNRNLEKELNTRLLKIPFPGRLNLNSKFIPKGKQLIKDGHNHTADIERFKAVIGGTPDKDGKIAKAINTDWYYFRKIDLYFMETLAT